MEPETRYEWYDRTNERFWRDITLHDIRLLNAARRLSGLPPYRFVPWRPARPAGVTTEGQGEVRVT